MTTFNTHTVALRSGLEVTLNEAGTGRPVLILHGGGGPATVSSVASHLAAAVHVIVPTHPGWNGTPRPDWLASIDDLAQVYLDYLGENKLSDILVIGSSLGGWIGAEMAVYDNDGRIAGLILIDAVGINVEDEPIRDFFALDAYGVAEYSFYDSKRFYVDPATLTPEQIATRQANMATMRVVAGDPYMHDPKLLGRLGHVQIPALVIWGESDGIVTPAYGAAYAAALPHARFETVAKAGHLPQLEQPAATFTLVDEHLNSYR